MQVDHLSHRFAQLPIDAEHCPKQKKKVLMLKIQSGNEGGKNNQFTPALFESPIFPMPEKKPHLQRLIKLEQETQSLSAKS